jgi:hypothetical protein
MERWDESADAMLHLHSDMLKGLVGVRARLSVLPGNGHVPEVEV